MNEPLTKKIKLGFSVSASTLILLTLLSFYNVHLLLNRSEWVNHTNEVLLSLQDVISGLKDAETGQRGYLLTKNPEFLEPYIGSYNHVFQSFNKVKTLTVDNEIQQQRLDTLRYLINERYNLISTTIDLQQAGKNDSAHSIVREGTGKKIMDQIREVIKRMSNEEIRLRKERNGAVRASSFMLPLLVLGFSGAALLITFLSYFFILRDNKKRVQTETDLALARDALEVSYEELTVREEELRALNVELEARVEERTEEVRKGMDLLKESERRYRSMIDGISDYAIFMLDPMGIIVSWNSGVQRLMGYKEREVIGMHFTIFLPKEPYGGKAPEVALFEAKENGRHEEEGWRVRKDSTLFWANVLITPILGDQGELIGYSKIIRDITERKKAEDNLRKANTDLDAFVYIASHDLKAPIANMEGLLNIVYGEMKPHCTEEIKDYFGMMETSMNKLKQIIRELSDVYNIQKTRGEDIEDNEVGGMLSEVMDRHHDIIENSGAKIYTDISISKIRFSKSNLFLILDNLVSNAIYYRSPVRAPEILVSTMVSEGGILLSVKDNGLGIDLTKKEKIFAMFQRLHSHVEGMGMGLYMTKRIIENAGGKIDVQSQLGAGSTFNVYFKHQAS